MPNLEDHTPRYASPHDCYGNPTLQPDGRGGWLEPEVAPVPGAPVTDEEEQT